MESGGKWKMQKVVKRSGTSDNPSDSLQAFSDMLCRGLDASAAPTACNSVGLLACSVRSRLDWNRGQSLATRYAMLMASSESSGSRLMGDACSRWSGTARLRMDAAKLHRRATALGEDFS